MRIITSWCIVHRDTKKKLSNPSTNCTPVKSESLMHPGAPVTKSKSFPMKSAISLMNNFPKDNLYHLGKGLQL